MKKEFRVKTNQDFQKVINGKKYSNHCYVTYYIKNDIDHPRFGIAASKKLGNAVIRSTTRRRVRAMIQEILKEDKVLNLDYVLIVKKVFLEKSYQENKNELKNTFQFIWRKMHEENK